MFAFLSKIFNRQRTKNINLKRNLSFIGERGTLYVLGKEFNDFHDEQKITNLKKSLLEDQHFMLSNTYNDKFIEFEQKEILTDIYKISEDKILNGNETGSCIAKLGDFRSYMKIVLLGLEYSESQKSLLKQLYVKITNPSITDWKVFINDENVRKSIVRDLKGNGFNNIQSKDYSVLLTASYSKKEKERYRREDDFKKFSEDGQEDFLKISKKDVRSDFFKTRYNLCICPGGRDGGINDSIFEMFWGARLLSQKKTINYVQFQSEKGATLLIEKNSKGIAEIYLRPFSVDNDSVSWIIYNSNVDPKKLLSHKYRKKLWQMFMAVSEKTCVDGDPSLWKTIKFSYLSFSKPKITPDGKLIRSQARNVFRTICKVFIWIIGVAFSGFAISILPHMLSNYEDKKQTKDKIEQTTKDSITKDSKVSVDKFRKDSSKRKMIQYKNN